MFDTPICIEKPQWPVDEHNSIADLVHRECFNTRLHQTQRRNVAQW